MFNARKFIQKEDDVVLIRVEQMSPFPYDLVQVRGVL